MSKYRRRPVIIEAEQWFPGNPVEGVVYPLPRELVAFCPAKAIKMKGLGWIDTLEGGHYISPGDWIITGVQGEKHSCKPDIFDKTYEKIED